uniref:DNA-(apurinic or apyrimidinic site) lyase n=1 Tax=Crypthecodinium cohnii TaxID=2866 RepID=A0A516AGU6_CRYCO|nr:endonuclease III-like protein 1 [Crypthecodinium cohnii]USW07808.1 endonuclease III-like protein 1 [Crypthecodinium cohnii]
MAAAGKGAGASAASPTKTKRASAASPSPKSKAKGKARAAVSVKKKTTTIKQTTTSEVVSKGVSKFFASGKGLSLKSSIPDAWKADWPIIKKLRETRDAPVDTVGCERLADPKAPKADWEWQCLVSAMLSSQTKDQANAEAMATLHNHGNTAANIARTPVDKLAKLISKVGFHNTKARYLKDAAKLCLEKHHGRVPDTLEGLLELPGVGPKMAHLVMHAAFDKQAGLCVDTHVHRIANALRWVKTPSAEATRVALEAWLPKREWPHINIVLVGLGQQQQQSPAILISRSLRLRNRAAALQLLARIGLKLSAGRYPDLDDAAKRDANIQKLLK